ncbi:iron chelate uptake ABC transporter family permease subunit [Limosilactobacillus fermentum]
MTATDANTLFNIRLPRIITALMAGAMSSVSGAFFQAALRNPIADPGIMGVSAGAALFAFVGDLRCQVFSSARSSSPLSAGPSPGGANLFPTEINPYRLILIGWP